MEKFDEMNKNYKRQRAVMGTSNGMSSVQLKNSILSNFKCYMLSCETSSLRILSQVLTDFLNKAHKEEHRRLKREQEEGPGGS